MIAEADGYSTHQVPLISAVMQTKGAIIELGTGIYSTPLLHEICGNRPLLSVDSDPEWLDNFRYLETENHKLLAIENHDWLQSEAYINTLANEGGIGVVFVDQGDVEARAVSIAFCADKADIIVVHDSNVAAYGYPEAFEPFRYMYEYTPHTLHTVVLSNVVDFQLQNEIGYNVR